MVRTTGRTRPWSDKDHRACDWSDKRNRPVKSMACAAWPQIAVGHRRISGAQQWERRRPAHADCTGAASGICGCNCHYTWAIDKDMVRLLDGAVGVVLSVDTSSDYLMAVRVGEWSARAVDVSEPILLAQEGDL